MGADQQFCLRWNNFHSNITSAFESLRDDEDFVDITLACDGRQIKAHKMVLSACSPYFRSLLKGNPCQHPIVFLKDVTFSNLSSILDFMYHGEVNVSHNELATFLKTAEALKVRGLAEDEKKKDSENYNESSSPPPPRDPPDPGSPRPEEGSSAPDTHLSDSPPPKRQRRRSGNSVHSTEDTNETVLSDQQVRDTSVKNEPQDFNEEEDILSQSVDQDVIKSDVVDDDRNFGPAESVTIRSQAAMQQLQESFGSFLPGMGQSPGFLPHGATDMPRPPPYPLEGVQGLPPGISALPGPSMSQGAASQDASQGARAWVVGGVGGSVSCPVCGKRLSNKYNLRIHIRDKHETHEGSRPTCATCCRTFKNANSLRVHSIKQHGHLSNRRRLRAAAAAAAAAMYRHHQHNSLMALNTITSSMHSSHTSNTSYHHHQQQQQQHHHHHHHLSPSNSTGNNHSSSLAARYQESVTSSSTAPSSASSSSHPQSSSSMAVISPHNGASPAERSSSQLTEDGLSSALEKDGYLPSAGDGLHLLQQQQQSHHRHATPVSVPTPSPLQTRDSHLQGEEPSPRLTSPAFRERRQSQANRQGHQLS
ncbi:protein bric-a-brac 2-like isoform X4 [Macrobrachium rosenbergii]|uniref:protein bric-a-brac 2-like isoform X4 n=1 Tax=Macrobrachium rosenbergii TaxID=79674 RepID=UPI0034D7A0D1